MNPPRRLADFPLILPGAPYAVSAHGTLYRLPGPDARGRVERTCKPVTVQVKEVTVWKWQMHPQTREFVRRPVERRYESVVLFIEGKRRHVSLAKALSWAVPNPAYVPP